MVEDEQINIADVEIKSNQNFTPPKKNIQSEIDDEKLKAVVLKNLPPLTQETDLRKYLQDCGLPLQEGNLKIHHNGNKSTTVDIEEIDAETCKLLIKNINEKIVSGRKHYCKALLDMETPEKKSDDINDHKVEEENGKVDDQGVDIKEAEDQQIDANKLASSSASKVLGAITKSNIPGLSAEEIKRNQKKIKEKKRREEKKKEEDRKKLESNDVRNNQIHTDKKSKGKSISSKESLDDTSNHDDFVFDDEEQIDNEDLLTPNRYNSRAAKTI